MCKGRADPLIDGDPDFLNLMSNSSPLPGLLIDGRMIAGDARLPVRDPATGEIFAYAPDCSRQQLDEAVAAARRAFDGWRQVPFEERRALLGQMADRIQHHAVELGALLTREQGKPLAAAARELDSTVRFLRGQCTLTLPETVNEDGPQRRSVTRRVPIGVIAALAPWNFPVLLAWWKVIPALLTGNTVVLKPSPLTPLTVLRIAEIMCDLLPPGVLNVVSGGDDLGPWLSAHDGVDKVSFTGSTATGKRIMAGAAPTLKRLTLELGGNDAAIVLPDVDVEAVVPSLFWSAFTNSGQVCIATKRLYVHADIYDAFAQALVRYARTVVMGPGTQAGTQLGPVQNRRQYESVLKLIDETLSAGHPILYQGDRPADAGYFVPLTIFDNPPEDSRVVQEEAFGPVLPLLRYDSIDEAVRRANASPYGLAGSVWSSDEALALDVAARLHTGTVWINEFQYLSPLAPFAGHKASGLGTEHGVDGLMACTEPQTIVLRKPA